MSFNQSMNIDQYYGFKIEPNDPSEERLPQCQMHYIKQHPKSFATLLLRVCLHFD